MATRQTRMPGTDSDRHKDLDNIAAKYVEARDARMQILQEEIELKEELHQLMKKYELTEYKIIDVTPNLLVTIEVTEETVKVKFYVHGTGHTVYRGLYVDTVIMPDGLVWHIYAEEIE